MSDAVVNNVKTFPDWKIALATIVFERGSFDDGHVTSEIRNFANTHQVGFSSARTAYYEYTKSIPNDLLDIITAEKSKEGVHKGQQSPSTPTTDTTNQNVSTTNKDTQPQTAKAPDVLELYPIGTNVEVEVTRIIQHGAVTVTCDAQQQEGFIYVGNLIDGYVSDINKYLHFGQKLTAKVLKYDDNKQQLTLSTKGFSLKETGVVRLGESYTKPPINVISSRDERLLAMKKQLEEEARERTIAHDDMFIPSSELDVPDTDEDNVHRPGVFTALIPATESANQEEIQSIRGFIKGVIGYDPSQKAVEGFLKLFAEHGVFNTSIAMARVGDQFEVDLGLLLMEKVGEVLGKHSS